MTQNSNHHVIAPPSVRQVCVYAPE